MRDSRLLRGASIFSVLAVGGCSMKQLAVDQMAQVLKDATRTYEQETDLALAADALPGSLKLIEGFLEADPEQAILLELLADGYTAYAFGFLEDEVERLQEEDPARAEALRQRALGLYLRARDFGLRLLALSRPEIAARLQNLEMLSDAELATLTPDDIAGMFWTASPWGAAIRVGQADPALMIQIPLVRRLLERCVQIEEAFYWGGAHLGLGVLEAATPKALGGRPATASRHFERALALTGGHHLMTRVLYARGVGVQSGDRELFARHLRGVLAADPDAEPRLGLPNRLAQRRAVRYLAALDDLFL